MREVVVRLRDAFGPQAHVKFTTAAAAEKWLAEIGFEKGAQELWTLNGVKALRLPPNDTQRVNSTLTACVYDLVTPDEIQFKFR